jgi:hypothetical protein
MPRSVGRSVFAAVLAVGAITAAGCGSNRPDSYGVSSSTPIDDAAVRPDLIHRLEQNGISANNIGPVVDCVIPKLQSAGINTVGDLGNITNLPKEVKIGGDCAGAASGQ